MSFVTLSGSHKSAPKGKKVHEVRPNKVLVISVQLPYAKPYEQILELVKQVESGARPPLSTDELVEYTGADPKHVGQVEQAAQEHGLTVLASTAASEAHGIVRLKGTYTRIKRFLPGLTLHLYKDSGKEFHGREGTINVIEGLPVVGVFGLDNREVARTHVRRHKKKLAPRKLPGKPSSRGVAAMQGVPVSETDKLEGVCTGYISLGGDNGKKMQGDLALAAKKDGIRVAKIVGVSVDGSKIDDDYNDDATVENALDMQAHALLNPNGYCVVFRAANSDDAFAQAMETANVYPGVKDPKLGNLPLLGVSISWGMAESGNSEQSLKRWQRASLAARLRGLIVTAATGDDGSSDRTDKATPDAPSCIPGIIGAAGVYIKSSDGKSISEIGVWNDMPFGGATGGGISAVFDLEPEEKELKLPVSTATSKAGHSASLVADDAAPSSGPYVWYKKKASPVGGTSHSAPFICIKLALIQASLTKKIPDMVGFIYKNAGRGIFRQVTVEGNNGDYSVKPNDLYGVPVGFGVIDFVKFRTMARQLQDGANS